MMNLKTILLISCSLLVAEIACAQETEQNLRMVKPFVADGISNEWNEPLNQFNSDTKLAFALANDDKNLYIIIESLDPITTRSILFGGITLNINTDGKKKNGINLTFPFRERPEGEKPENQNGEPRNGDGMREKPKQGQEEFREEDAEKQSLKVSGFANIKDGVLKPDNEFGIASGMVVKKNQDLIYEIAIPLSQLQVNVDWKKAIAYNIKLNSTKKKGGERGKADSSGGGKGGNGGGGRQGGGGQGSGGGSGGMGGGSGGGRGGERPSQDSSGSESTKSDFWIKYKLVKA